MINMSFAAGFRISRDLGKAWNSYKPMVYCVSQMFSLKRERFISETKRSMWGLSWLWEDTGVHQYHTHTQNPPRPSCLASSLISQETWAKCAARPKHTNSTCIYFLLFYCFSSICSRNFIGLLSNKLLFQYWSRI